MAQYALFHDARRFLASVDLSGVSEPFACHHNKDQLSKWLGGKMPKAVTSDAASMHGVNYFSFEIPLASPFGYMADESRKGLITAIARVINQMSFHKESNPSAYGGAFTIEHVNVMGAHSYDFDTVNLEDDEVLISSNSGAPDDFIERFPRKMVSFGKNHSRCLTLVKMGSIASGVAMFAKNGKIMQIHVGAAVCQPINVRIITNEPRSSNLDKMISIGCIIEKASL